MKIYIPHSTSYDYLVELYQPIHQARTLSDYNIVLPHEHSDQPTNTLQLIKTCSLIIAEVSFPSTGLGIELGWANTLQIPITCIYKENAQPSSSLIIISTKFYSYTTPDELPELIKSILTSVDYNEL